MSQPQLSVETMDIPAAPLITAERRLAIAHSLHAYCLKITAERRIAVKEAATMAGYCIEDAFQGRLSNGLASNSKKSAEMLAIFRIQTSEWLLNLILFCSVFHTVCVFYESSDVVPAWVWSLNTLFVVSVYSLDVGLKMAYQGVDEYFSHDWQKLYVLSISVMLLELACAGRIRPRRVCCGRAPDVNSSPSSRKCALSSLKRFSPW